jgi:hypothetical protein
LDEVADKSAMQTKRRRLVNNLKRGQSTLEWVIGAAIILGTLVVGIMAWNNGLVAKIGQMVQRLTQTS